MSSDPFDLYLVRHGTTDSNLAGRLQGQRDVVLSARGKAEAEATGRYLAQVLKRPDGNGGSPQGVPPGTGTGQVPFTLYASPLRRAMATAESLAAHLSVPIRSDAAWMEMDVGDLEGSTWAENEVRYPAVIAQWYSAPRTVRFPGAAESIGQFVERVAQAVQALWDTPQDGPVVVVTHGGPLNVALSHLLKLGLPDAFPFHFSNCGVTLVRRTGTRLRVRTLNHTCHLNTLPDFPATPFQVG